MNRDIIPTLMQGLRGHKIIDFFEQEKKWLWEEHNRRIADTSSIEHLREKHLALDELFLSIQGEGPLVGTPTVFTRTVGCDLSCQYCDTGYRKGDPPHKTSLVSALDVANLLKITGDALNICWTGGEPTLQWDTIKEITKYLRTSWGREVSIETHAHNASPSLMDLVENIDVVVASPKLPGSGNPCPRDRWRDILRFHWNHEADDKLGVFFLKLVVRQGNDEDIEWVKEAAKPFHSLLYVQLETPVDEKGQSRPEFISTPWVNKMIKLCAEIDGLILLPQVHKYLNLA